MFNFIRRHQAIALVFILMVCVSFVVFFTPGGQGGSAGGGPGEFGTLNGKPIKQKEFHDAYKDVMIGYRIRSGDWPSDGRSGFNISDEARNRLVIVDALQRNKIHPDDRAVAEWIRPQFTDPSSGEFNQEIFELFTTRILKQGGMDKTDFYRFVGHEIAVQQMVSLAGLPGALVVPAEAEELYRQQNESAAATSVLFSGAKFKDQVPQGPQEIAAYFAQNKAIYRTPERIQVGYVRFDATNYLAEAEVQMNQMTNLTERVDQTFSERGAEAFTGDDDKELSESAAKAQIREDLKQRAALIEAHRAAIELSNHLLDVPYEPDLLDKVAAANGVQSFTTAPFDSREGPSEPDLFASFALQAFKLSMDNPFTPPIRDEAQQAVYVMSFKQKIPSAEPEFDAVRVRVVADYVQRKSREAARTAGRAFYNSLTNGMAQGKTFEELTENPQNGELITLPIFSESTRQVPGLDQRLNIFSLKREAFKLQPGAVSPFTPTSDGGFILRLDSLTPAVDQVVAAELPEFIEDLQRQRRFTAFNEWMRHQIELAGITTPVTEGDSAAAPDAATN